MRPQKRLRAPPPITETRLDARARREQRLLAVGEREGDAFEHGARQIGARRRVRQAEEHAGRVGIVVRRALAGEVGQEERRAGRASARSTSASSAASLAAPVSARHPASGSSRR